MEFRDCRISLSDNGTKVYITCDKTKTNHCIPLNRLLISMQSEPPYYDYDGIPVNLIKSLPRNYKLMYVEDKSTGDRFYTFEGWEV